MAWKPGFIDLRKAMFTVTHWKGMKKRQKSLQHSVVRMFISKDGYNSTGSHN